MADDQVNETLSQAIHTVEIPIFKEKKPEKSI